MVTRAKRDTDKHLEKLYSSGHWAIASLIFGGPSVFHDTKATRSPPNVASCWTIQVALKPQPRAIPANRSTQAVIPLSSSPLGL